MSPTGDSGREEKRDPYGLERFVRAQAGIYDRVLDELRAGTKRSHWMWFIFPQIKGLGMSEMSVRFAIDSLDEARAYLAHALLGQRLNECVETVLSVKHGTAEQIFGYPDDMKFRSSMTLFVKASEQGSAFERALARYFNGQQDEATLKQLA
jgi:uncharacterized protein (DUF1810 family)